MTPLIIHFQIKSAQKFQNCLSLYDSCVLINYYKSGMYRLSLFLAVFFIFNSNANAYEIEQGRLKVFMEGAVVDFNYIRNTISFVDYVNDPTASDLHIIVTAKPTAAGGHHYFVSFKPQTIKTIDNITLNCISSIHDSREELRFKFAETVKSGLLLFATEKQLYYEVDVQDTWMEEHGQIQKVHSSDPWNLWVFNVGLSGGFRAEEQKQNYDFRGNVEANRVTNILRVRNGYRYEQNGELISISDSENEDIRVSNRKQVFWSNIAYSLSSHWSLGMSVYANQDTYRNIHLNASLSPAIEYNIYPWEELDRRVFTIAYHVGPTYYSFYERTIFDEMSNLYWYHRLRVDMEKVEDWGKLNVRIMAEQYLPDIEYFAFRAGGGISVRITKGLFFNGNMQAEKINNQIYLPAGEVSNEDLLLNTRQLPTSFGLSGWLGVRYQFGSIYNNVVNLRL